MSKIDPSLFSSHVHALDKANNICPVCGSALQMKQGKHGLFFGCTNFPDCDFIRPLHSSTGETIEKILENSECPVCHLPLAIKKGRFGLFIGCTGFPACQHIESNTDVSGGDIDAVEKTIPCPDCKDGTLQSKISRYGKRFWACSKYPSCKFITNDKPIATVCPECHSPILIERKNRNGIRYFCVRKECTYQTESL